MLYRILALLMMTVFFPFVSLVLLVYAGFCFYAFKTFQVAKLRAKADQIKSIEGVSIIIPFRNEADNIKACLAAIKAQEGVDFPFEF